MKLLSVAGFGKLYHGLVYPILSNSFNSDTFFISFVKPSDTWANVQKNGDLNVHVVDVHGKEVYSSYWLIKESNESISAFIERCSTNNIRNGIVILENDDDLEKIISISHIFATCAGISGLRETVENITRIDNSNLRCIYAFENKPTAINAILQDYHLNEKGLELIPCPVDRVVVDRKFNNSFKNMVVYLGSSPKYTDLFCHAACSRLYQPQTSPKHGTAETIQCDLPDRRGRIGRYGKAPAFGSRRRP